MYIPMVVEGVVELDGKKYLQIEGGQLKLGNLFVEPGANDGGANALMANMLLTISEMTSRLAKAHISLNLTSPMAKSTLEL